MACALVLNALVGEKGLLAIMQARRQYVELDAALERARQENARLREEARRLREDPAAIEEIARRDIGFIKRGEKVHHQGRPATRSGSEEQRVGRPPLAPCSSDLSKSPDTRASETR